MAKTGYYIIRFVMFTSSLGHMIVWNQSDLLQATISVASKKSFSTLNSPYDSMSIHFPSSDIPVAGHDMNK